MNFQFSSRLFPFVSFVNELKINDSFRSLMISSVSFQKLPFVRETLPNHNPTREFFQQTLNFSGGNFVIFFANARFFFQDTHLPDTNAAKKTPHFLLRGRSLRGSTRLRE